MSLNRPRSSLVPQEAVRSLGFQELVSSMRSAITRIGKVGNGVALGTLLAISACQPDPQEKCKGKVCDVSNPDDNGTPTDTTDTTDNNTDPTCPPDCPEVPDTTPPKAPMFAIGVTQVTVGPSTTIYSADVTIPSDPDANMQEIRFQVDAGTPTVIPYTGQTSITVDIPAGKTGTIILADKAGNTSSASLRVNIDATPPGTPSFSIDGSITVGPTVSSVPVVLTLPNPLDTETVETKVDSGAWTPEAYTPGASTLNLDIPAGYTLYARATDKVGNISGEDSVTVNVDTEAPLMLYPATATQITLGPTEFSTPVTFTVGEPVETHKVLASFDGGAYAEIPYTSGDGFVVINLNKGSSVKTKAVDTNNNESAESIAVSALAEAVPAAAGVSQDYFALNASAPTFSFDVTPPTGVNYIEIEDELENIVYAGSVTPPTPVTVTLNNPMENKTYTVFVRAPKGTWSVGKDVTLEYDNVTPAAPVITTNFGENFGVDQPNFTLEGTCDGSDTQKMQYKIDSGEWQDIPEYVEGSNNWSFNGTVGSFEFHDYYFRAFDKAKNISQTDQIQVTGVY